MILYHDLAQEKVESGILLGLWLDHLYCQGVDVIGLNPLVGDGLGRQFVTFSSLAG